MQQRLSAGAIVFRDQKLLLVHHKSDEYDFWVMPGGGMENGEGIFKCAVREVLEETSLQVKPEKIVYVEELIDKYANRYLCKIWVSCSVVSGNISHKKNTCSEASIIDARFYNQDELVSITAYPSFVKSILWKDFHEGYPQIRYINNLDYKDNSE